MEFDKMALGKLADMTVKQQAAIGKLLGDWDAEIGRLKVVTADTRSAAVKVSNVVGKIDEAADSVKTAAATGAYEAVKPALEEAMKEVSTTAAEIVDKTTTPLLAKLVLSINQADEATRQVETKMRDAAQWFRWKTVAVMAGAAAAGVILIWAMAAVQVSSARDEARKITEQRDKMILEMKDLAATIDRMKTTVAQLKVSGATVHDCGGRKCFEARVNQGENTEWHAAWHTEYGEPLVILSGN